MAKQTLDRNLALELARVTEAAALAAAPWVGRGDKNSADHAAVEAMRKLLPTVQMHGVIVIGEGEKDEAPMLYNGEKVGNGSGPEVDIAVDPIDGTTLTSKGGPNALAVIAVSERGTMFNPGPAFYMEKIAVGPEAADVIDIRESITTNLELIAKAKGKPVTDLTVAILERERHANLIGEVRESGARINLLTDGDVAGAIATAWRDSGVDALFGVGGTPEGVIAAAALKCMGGAIQGRIWAGTDDQRVKIKKAGFDFSTILTTNDLVKGDNCFFAATGVTDGDLLQGVRYYPNRATSQSLVMRSKSGTVRMISTVHRIENLKQFLATNFK